VSGHEFFGPMKSESGCSDPPQSPTAAELQKRTRMKQSNPNRTARPFDRAAAPSSTREIQPHNRCVVAYLMSSQTMAGLEGKGKNDKELYELEL